jgi:hypothetical protein
VMDYRIGVLELVGRILQRMLQVDLAHLDLRAGRRGWLLPDGAGDPLTERGGQSLARYHSARPSGHQTPTNCQSDAPTPAESDTPAAAGQSPDLVPAR